MATAFDRIKETEEFQLHRRIEKHRRRQESRDRQGREAQMAELAERRRMASLARRRGYENAFVSMDTILDARQVVQQVLGVLQCV
jgi:hypothetical protein